MTLSMPVLALFLAGIAALFSLLTFFAVRRARSGLTPEAISGLLRNESEQIRRFGDDQARGLRQELSENLRGFQDTTLRGFRDLGERLETQVKEFGEKLDNGVSAIRDVAGAIAIKLEQDIARMGQEANQNRDTLRQTIEGKLDTASDKQSMAAKVSREETTSSFRQLGADVAETLRQMSEHQKERLEKVTTALGLLSEKQERSQEALKQTVEIRLDAIRVENASKLDEMRITVDEKLHSTLESRLGESFNRVVEQLERVHKGIGEMQTLAAGVGDLKKVLSNVRVRGTFGEVQLAALVEQVLSPDQYVKNAQVKENSQERVEYAIKMPGHDSDGVLLPVDAKFPQEDYERLLNASEQGDAEGVAASSKELENRVRSFARSIHEKYISPPRTTDFAFLFLPTESLYAEILRRPGLFEQIQREYHVVLTGPTTFAALLNALQMGFRSLAIEKRSSEVWKVLGAVNSEFAKYGDVVGRLSKQLESAKNSVDNLGTRARAMRRKLRDVETLPDETAQILLGPEFVAGDEEEEEVEIQAAKVA